MRKLKNYANVEGKHLVLPADSQLPATAILFERRRRNVLNTRYKD
jgi:hypothetical protein